MPSRAEEDTNCQVETIDTIGNHEHKVLSKIRVVYSSLLGNKQRER